MDLKPRVPAIWYDDSIPISWLAGVCMHWELNHHNDIWQTNDLPKKIVWGFLACDNKKMTQNIEWANQSANQIAIRARTEIKISRVSDQSLDWMCCKPSESLRSKLLDATSNVHGKKKKVNTSQFRFSFVHAYIQWRLDHSTYSNCQGTKERQ